MFSHITSFPNKRFYKFEDYRIFKEFQELWDGYIIVENNIYFIVL